MANPQPLLQKSTRSKLAASKRLVLLAQHQNKGINAWIAGLAGIAKFQTLIINCIKIILDSPNI
jgi:hypothetical protein